MEAVIPIERVIFSERRVFAVKIILTLSYNTAIIYCVFVDQLWEQQANCTDKHGYFYIYFRPS